MMKVFASILTSVLFLTSCVKQEIVPQEPITPQPIITNPTLVDSTLSLAGQTWVITKVLNTDMVYENRSDTLVFIDSDDYKFNGYPSKYNLGVTPTSFKLSLYDTAWGNIGGSLYNYNIVSGKVDGLDFYDIFNSSRKVKLWMTKL
jgi:hypothetical protein